MVLEESHQEAETDENHNVHVLEHGVITLDGASLFTIWINIFRKSCEQAVQKNDHHLHDEKENDFTGSEHGLFTRRYLVVTWD